MTRTKVYNPLMINWYEGKIYYEDVPFITVNSLLPEHSDSNHIIGTDEIDFWSTKWYPTKNFSINGQNAVLRRNLSVLGVGGMQTYYLLATKRVRVVSIDYHNLIRDVSNRKFLGLCNGLRVVLEALSSHFKTIITDDDFVLNEIKTSIHFKEFISDYDWHTSFDPTVVESNINSAKLLELEGPVLSIATSNSYLSSMLISETQSASNCAMSMINIARRTNRK